MTTVEFTEKGKTQYAVFRAVMLRNIARLSHNTGAYVGRLSKRDKDWVLEKALWSLYFMQDWTNINKSLTYKWDICLRNAIASRAGWSRSRHDGWDYVCSFRLLRAVTPVGEEYEDQDASLSRSRAA